MVNIIDIGTVLKLVIEQLIDSILISLLKTKILPEVIDYYVL